MRKISTICLSLLMAVGMQVSASSKTNVGLKFHRTPSIGVSVPGMVDRSNATQQMKAVGLWAGIKNAPERVAASDATSSLSEQGFGWIDGPDGYPWYYTQKSTFHSNPAKPDSKAEYYTSSTVTLYDNTNKKVGSFTVTPPEGYDLCNSLQFYGPVTKKLFDNDQYSYEIMAYFHNADAGATKEMSKAYSVETGDELFSCDGMAIIFDASTSSWNTYQRLLVVGTDVTDGKTYDKVDVYGMTGWGSNAKFAVEHTFKVPAELTVDLEGAYVNGFIVDGKPYYAISQYEKPWGAQIEDTDDSDSSDDSATDGDDSGDSSDSDASIGDLQTKDNHFIVTIYDRNFDQVDQLSIPIGPKDSNTACMGGFGTFGFNDLSKNYFDKSGKFNYVVGIVDYNPKEDGDLVSFGVYDSANGKIKDICDNIGSDQYGILNEIPGKDEQMFFMQDNDGVQQIVLKDFPSCETVTTLPATIEGNSISTTFDRIASNKNDKGYQYVIKLAQGETNDAEEVLCPIAWVNPDCTIDHKDMLNIGEAGENFMPLLNSTTMDPYLFDTNDDMEYVFISKQKRKGKIYNVLQVTSSDGTPIKTFESDDNLTFRTASVPLMNDKGKHQFVVSFENAATGNVDVDFYDLPFNKFAEGGEGTVDDPFMVSTAGDLRQMSLLPRRHYKLANDIDMTAAGYWTPVENFYGSLDGDNHAIFNLNVNGTSGNVGLVGTLSYGASIKNLNVINPTITMGDNANYAGVIAGQATTSKNNGAEGVVSFENVHVLGANICSETASPKVGGIVGSAALYAKLKGCSFDGSIYLPENWTATGGLVGELETSSTVESSSANVTATASSTLGGIAGFISADAKVLNCEAQGELTAENTIGGIVADSERGLIDKCINKATVHATKGTSYAGYSTGGIVGKLAEDWPSSSEDTRAAASSAVISNCVAAGKILVDENTEYNPTAVANAKRVHMIAGSTINDSSDDDATYTEGGLANNYTTADFSTNTDATTVEGKYVAKNDLKKDFFTAAGYAYGKTNDAPWKGSAIPTLYFNDEAKAISVSASDITVGLNAPEATFKVTVYGVDNADEVDAISLNNAVAEVALDKVEGNVAIFKVTGKNVGVTAINVTYGDLDASCSVMVLKNVVNGIETIENDDFAVRVADGIISAEGAKSIDVYAVGGQLVAKSNGSAISTAQMAKGIYVVKATDKAGHKSTAKFVVK